MSAIRFTPETAGYGFVLGVVAGISMSDALVYVALCAVVGAVLAPVVWQPLRACGSLLLSWRRAGPRLPARHLAVIEPGRSVLARPTVFSKGQA